LTAIGIAVRGTGSLMEPGKHLRVQLLLAPSWMLTAQTSPHHPLGELERVLTTIHAPLGCSSSGQPRGLVTSQLGRLIEETTYRINVDEQEC
jgi:hypothetical protein